MKSKPFLIILCIALWLNSTFSQEVEKSIFGMQTGFLGVWFNHELSLNHHWVLHTELGLDGALSRIVDNGDFPIILPMISFQPRYYYNLPKRQAEMKDISDNSGNYLAINFLFYPNFLSYSTQENINIKNGLFIMPSWGIRRNFNRYFYYELGLGAGFNLSGISEIKGNESILIYNILARVGYKMF